MPGTNSQSQALNSIDLLYIPKGRTLYLCRVDFMKARTRETDKL